MEGEQIYPTRVKRRLFSSQWFKPVQRVDSRPAQGVALRAKVVSILIFEFNLIRHTDVMGCQVVRPLLHPLNKDPPKRLRPPFLYPLRASLKVFRIWLLSTRPLMLDRMMSGRSRRLE